MLNPTDEMPHVLSVSRLTEEIKLLLEGQFDHISVRGEISQPQTSRNGHLYFTLKDEGAQLSCVMWNSKRMLLDKSPEHGQEVVVTGPLQVYAPHGRYQMIVQSISETGLGALQLAFEKLKKKLESEGLFDPARKRPLPLYPAVIGIVTSATGAAFQDMRNTLEKRWPMCEVRLYHAAVQGFQAAMEITNGIRHFAKDKEVDLLIVGRGGGSLEDLQAFNEEIVARAIAESPVPVISAVGHETDFSISDFVADVRAATPTQAIVLAVPDANDLRMKLDEIQLAVEKRVFDIFGRHRETVSRFLDNYALHKVHQRINRNKEALDWQMSRMKQTLLNRVRQPGEQVRRLTDQIRHTTDRILMQKKVVNSELHQRLLAADPNFPLKKGYTRIHQDGKWVRAAGSFSPDRSFEIEWVDRQIAIKKPSANV